MREQLPLTGKVALVTGAARGIGRAYAVRLAELGADVAVVDRDLRSFTEEQTAGGRPTDAAVTALGRRAVGLTADVTDPGSVETAVNDAVAALGRLDILVCNAGGGSGSMTDSLASRATAEHVEAVVQRNLVGTITTCRAVVHHMRGHGWGRIVTVSSLAGRRAFRNGGYAVYGAAKAGIAMYTQSLAQELGPEGITVNCLAPGYIATGRMSVMFENLGADDLRETVALRRFGTPDDCAGALEFLVTDLGSYVTGTVIPVDGGTSI
ncbi:MAG: SDR family NAD(P)-dependent oxidoreductase [Georgenia sp.]